MNDPHDGSELPELSDDDVRLLYSICQRASTSPAPPFKALFAAYDAILKEEHISQEHDGVIFRALLRVGESTAEANKQRQAVDLVERLENVLEARGITLVREDGEEHTGAGQPKKLGRRVSFDDARLEETWLSEHSEAVNPPSPQPAPPNSLLSLPARRARQAHSGRRARSTSSQRSVLRQPAPKLYQTSSSQDHLSDDEDAQKPTLHFEVSQTQLEINADAFLGTSEFHLQRRALRLLHNRTLQLQASDDQSSGVAAAHDRRILLKQALETWRGALQERRFDRRQEQHYLHLEAKAERARSLFLITKAFTHWATQCSDERFRTRIAQHYVLRAKYFKRWKAIAIENQAKTRRILCRKYLAIWREKTTRRLLSDEQAESWYEERLMRRCKLRMFWEFCARQVLGNHDEWIKRRALSHVSRVLQARQDAERQAAISGGSNTARTTMKTLTTCLYRRYTDGATAAVHYDRSICSRALQSMKIRVRLAPLERTLTLKINLDLLRKCFSIWHRNRVWAQQADSVRTRMLLHNGFTMMGDVARSNAMVYLCNWNLKKQTLFTLLLQAKLSRYQRQTDGNLLSRLLNTWRARVGEERDKLGYAEAVFVEAQHRRRLRFGIERLHLAYRQREDAERAAVEFRNSRDLPFVWDSLATEHEHRQKLENWARMANFYRLATRTLKVWRERTTEHQANRRRNAYARVRARVKIRVVATCFARLREKAVDVRSMRDEADRRAADRLAGMAAGALIKWRQRTTQMTQLGAQAAELYQVGLLRSALGTLLTQFDEKTALLQRLEQAKLDTDLALLASVWRRLEWESFKAARNHESAEALRLRNRDVHAKHMLRHWALQTAAKRLPPIPPPRDETQDPESPSLRPASRAASRAATTPATLPPSSPPQRSGRLDSAPGYMRTPSRSRRAGRFRPLPTPAAGMTPFAFDHSYLATTPAPLSIAPAPAADVEGLTPQVTPFNRKLRAGGVPASALRPSVLGRSVLGGTGKSVRFAGGGGRFAGGRVKGS